MQLWDLTGECEMRKAGLKTGTSGRKLHPAILRQNLFFLQKPQVLLLGPLADWMGATTVLSVISSTEVLMMDVSHIHKMPSRQHLDKCLVESLDTGLPNLTQTVDHHSTYQMFFLGKIPIFAL